MIEFISNGVDINGPDDYGVWMSFSKSFSCSELNSLLSEVSVTLLKNKCYPLIYYTPWPVSFNNFSTSQTHQIPKKIITKFVGTFWVQV